MPRGPKGEKRYTDPARPPLWLHLLSPVQRAWREKQIMTGRNPDTDIEESLIEAGLWKPPTEKSDDAPRS